MTNDASLPPQPDSEIITSLRQLGLLDDETAARFTALTGGVSSDIWLVETPERTYCVKRALAKLKVAADWFAPVERNRFEVAWYRLANALVPGAAPRILAHDEAAMLCAMEYLDPADHRLWKTELRDGRVDSTAAAQAGKTLALIHGGTSDTGSLESIFTRPDIFHAIRLEPYLEATGDRHPDLRERLFDLSGRTNATRLVMIHGDVSPKNILLGPNGPVFLDAECATIGDPAFDLAFCLNHFLLKCLWTPSAADRFLEAFAAMSHAYLANVTWEPAKDLEARAASLLPGLFLARVDGKSPVEYITEEAERDKVRACARPLLFEPPERLGSVAQNWMETLRG